MTTASQLSDKAMREAHWSSSRRRIGFRALSVLLGLLVPLYFLFGLTEVVLMWLPDSALSDGFGDYPGGIPVHRSHFMAIGLVAWTVVPAVVVQLRKPWRREAAMLVAAVMAVAGLVAYGLAGTLLEWLVEDVVLAVLILALAALHPRRRSLLRRPAFDPTMVRLAALAAGPWAVYGIAQVRLQVLSQTGDIHGGLEHWAAAALLAVAVVTTAVVGATDHAGWRLPAWTSVAVSGVFGIHSLVFPGLASGLPAVAAVGAVVWAVAFAWAILRRARAVRVDGGAGLAPPAMVGSLESMADAGQE